MSHLATILGLIGAKVRALPGTPLQYAGGDWRDDLASIAADTEVYQLRAQHQQEVIRSNVSYQTASVEVAIIYHLLDSEAATERTYTQFSMLLDQEQLLDRNWWNTIAGIYQIEEDGRPQIQIDVDRGSGNIIVYSVLCTFEIVPE
jgi:hypothetical protein